MQFTAQTDLSSATASADFSQTLGAVRQATAFPAILHNFARIEEEQEDLRPRVERL